MSIIYICYRTFHFSKCLFILKLCRIEFSENRWKTLYSWRVLSTRSSINPIGLQTITVKVSTYSWSAQYNLMEVPPWIKFLTELNFNYPLSWMNTSAVLKSSRARSLSRSYIAPKHSFTVDRLASVTILLHLLTRGSINRSFSVQELLSISFSGVEGFAQLTLCIIRINLPTQETISTCIRI